MKSFKTFIPLIIVLIVMGFLWRGLDLQPQKIPSPLINQPTPLFHLPLLSNNKKIISNSIFYGKVTLVNVWATWCNICLEEHGLLMEISKNPDITLIGWDYKDEPNYAKKWLAENGNPYKLVIVDENGHAAIDWGVYGTPETFIVDKKGMIRYKHIGAITPDIWNNKLKPVIQQLQDESP